MTITCWNEVEDEALQGLPWSGQLLYLRGLRRRMDYRTGMVGTGRNKISWQTFHEVLHVDHHQGINETSLTKDQLRRALKWLVKSGLVEVRTEGRYLQFFLPLADRDSSVQKKAAPRPHHVRTIKAAPCAEDLTAYENREYSTDTIKSRTTSAPSRNEKAALHPESGIKDKKPYTEADASVSAPPVVSRDQIPSPIEPQRQAPLLPPVALTNTAPPREPRAKVAKPRVSTAPVWAAYSAAYRERYGVTPVRNSTINGQLAHLVRRLGDEAPAVARYYLDLEDPYYRREGHSFGALLKHCEQLRTLWKRAEQRRASPSAARNPDDVVIAL